MAKTLSRQGSKSTRLSFRRRHRAWAWANGASLPGSRRWWRASPNVSISRQSELARVPAKWKHFAEEDSRLINILELILSPQSSTLVGFALDHDEFGSSRSKLINVIDSNIVARDSREKPVPTFSHPALGRRSADEHQRQAEADHHGPADAVEPFERAAIAEIA